MPNIEVKGLPGRLDPVVLEKLKVYWLPNAAAAVAELSVTSNLVTVLTPMEQGPYSPSRLVVTNPGLLVRPGRTDPVLQLLAEVENDAVLCFLAAAELPYEFVDVYTLDRPVWVEQPTSSRQPNPLGRSCWVNPLTLEGNALRVVIDDLTRRMFEARDRTRGRHSRFWNGYEARLARRIEELRGHLQDRLPS